MRRLLIVDEQPVMRCGITTVINEAGIAVDLKGVGTAAEAVAVLRAETWSAAMVDIGLSESGGISFLSRVTKEHPKLSLLVYTAMPESPYGLRSLRSGATGFLHKSTPADMLADAVRRTLAGRRYVSPTLAEQLVDRMVNDSDAAPHDLLTDREFEIFRLIALGNSMVDIGESLNISPKTVQAHRTNILRKTGLANNQALTSYAFKQRLIPGRRSNDRSLTPSGD
jgi:two-component system, NarL family, invasion response regulator UvrY